MFTLGETCSQATFGLSADLDPWNTQFLEGGIVGSLGTARMKLGYESGFKVLENKKHILELEPFESCQAGFFFPPKSPLNSYPSPPPTSPILVAL